MVRQCQFETLDDLYSDQGVKQLEDYFSRPLQAGTKKANCQAYIHFLDFLEGLDEILYVSNERKRTNMSSTMKQAYLGFCRGVKLSESCKRNQISDMIRLGQFPTYGEVCSTFESLSKLMTAGFFKKRSLSKDEFANLIAYIGYGLVKRCVIRPGALTKMKLNELKNPKCEGSDFILIHNKGSISHLKSFKIFLFPYLGQKAASYNDGFVNFPRPVYEALLHYVNHWRPTAISDDEAVVLTLKGDELTSARFSQIMASRFSEKERKNFVFTAFRQLVQTVFTQSEKNDDQKKWFNQIMQHR